MDILLANLPVGCEEDEHDAAVLAVIQASLANGS
jgi:hypothetical protein